MEYDTLGDMSGRSPHGERGLKYHHAQTGRPAAWSLSSRRAWIEIDSTCPAGFAHLVALLTESVD